MDQTPAGEVLGQDVSQSLTLDPVITLYLGEENQLGGAGRSLEIYYLYIHHSTELEQTELGNNYRKVLRLFVLLYGIRSLSKY